MSAIKGPLLSVENNSFVSWLCARLHSVAALILHLQPRANLRPAAVQIHASRTHLAPAQPTKVFDFCKCCLNRGKEPTDPCQCFNEIHFYAGRFVRRLQRLTGRDTCLEKPLCAAVTKDPGVFLLAVSAGPFCGLCPEQLARYSV